MSAQGEAMWCRLLGWLSLAAIAAGAPASQGELGFPLEFKDGFLWVKVNVARAEQPLNFIVDTGAEVSTLSLQTARRLKLHGGRPVKVTGVGASTTGYWPQTLEAVVGGVKLPSKFLVTDLCALEENCQCPVDGLLGADFFQDRVVQIDFGAKKIRLLAAAPDAAKGAQIPIRFRRTIMSVPMNVDGNETQWMRLDTGCASALEWVSPRADKKRSGAKISIGVSPIRIPMAQARVDLGKWHFDKVWTGIHKEPLFPSEGGLLGLGLLSRFHQITIDAQNGNLILSPAAE